MSHAYWQNEYVTKGSTAQREHPHELLVGTLSRLLSSVPPEKLSSLSVLDIGCGNGRHLKLLQGWGCHTELYGLDWSEKACSLSGQLVPQAHIWEASFMQLPFADHSFDLVIDVLNHQHTSLGDYRTAISEAARVLKPGGYFYTYRFSNETDIHNPLLKSGDFSLLSKAKVAEVLSGSGLGIVHWETVTRDIIFPAPGTYVGYHSILARKEN